jgi:two-component system OmpR family sensor kinase
VRLSLRNRLALIFFAIMLMSIGALYLYVAPGIQSRLMDAKLGELATSVHAHGGPLRRTVGSSTSLPAVRELAVRVAGSSGDRITLLSVNEAQGAHQLATVADSSNPAASGELRFPVARRAINLGRLVTGTEPTLAGTTAEAALPVRYQGRTAAVIVFSAPVSDIVRAGSTVRHQILVAGAIALAVALIAGYLVARWLSQRVRRLERAAKRVAAGEFGHPIRVDSSDELGQLASTFNAMQAQLEQLDLARKKFIATASHELRTPVFSLGGFLELLEDEDLDAQTRRRFLDQVGDQVRRLGKLSVDLLDLSRLEAGSLDLNPEDVDLSELTRSVSGEFEPSLAQHDSRLELRLPSRRLDVQCDPVRVAQIMRILIDNALTHNPSGTMITVTAGRENGSVRLAVRDDGRGIDAAVARRIFEPFYTADDAQGSGLGLAIARELAERMSGALSLNSASGSTEFRLELPGA